MISWISEAELALQTTTAVNVMTGRLHRIEFRAPLPLIVPRAVFFFFDLCPASSSLWNLILLGTRCHRTRCPRNIGDACSCTKISIRVEQQSQELIAGQLLSFVIAKVKNVAWLLGPAPFSLRQTRAEIVGLRSCCRASIHTPMPYRIRDSRSRVIEYASALVWWKVNFGSPIDGDRSTA